MKLLPMDLVRLPDGTPATVNSAHYLDGERQGFSVCGKPVPDDGGPIYWADECEFLHRCEFKPCGPVQRCACGAIRTTLAEAMAGRPSGVPLQ